MKITKEHLDFMKQEIDSFLDKQGREAVIEAYETGKFPRSERVKDLQTRFNFDLMYCAKLTPFICETIYKYAHDEHIATALKAICPKVTKRY